MGTSASWLAPVLRMGPARGVFIATCRLLFLLAVRAVSATRATALADLSQVVRGEDKEAAVRIDITRFGALACREVKRQGLGIESGFRGHQVTIKGRGASGSRYRR